MSIRENIMYDRLDSISPDKLKNIEHTIPKPSEINLNKSEEQIRSENIYVNRLSKRNALGNYIIPSESDSVLINLIPSKLIVPDSSLNYLIDNSFQYFIEPVFSDTIPEPISFAEGTIFRVTGEGIRPKDKYTYYSIEKGIVSLIPNYKTVEVLLFERGRGFDDIQVIEPTEFDDLLHTSLINTYIKEGLTPEQASEEVAKLIVTTNKQNNTSI
jgi:hypothetical protein